MMKHVRLTRKSGRRGAALVEMAITLPLFFMIVLGIVEFGRAMMVSQLLANAAREGARVAILAGNTNTDVQTAIIDFLQASANIHASDVTVTITVQPATGNPNPGNSVANAKTRDLCSISVVVPFNKVSYIKAKYLTGKSLSGKCAMRHE